MKGNVLNRFQAVTTALIMTMLMIATGASAQNCPGAWSITPFIGQLDFADSLHYKTASPVGFAFGYNLDDAITLEASMCNAGTEETRFGTTVDGDANLYRLEGLYHFNDVIPIKKLVPFAALGIGDMMLDSDRAGSGADDDFVFDYGVGAKYFITQGIALRIDARHLMSFKEAKASEVYNSFIYTIGLTLQFCKQEVAAPVIEAPVPREEIKQKEPEKMVAPVVITPPADSDHDGVPDTIDKCPDTPAGVAVDEVGCPKDTDEDGVPDYRDMCPNTPKGTKVDANGCPIPEKAVVTAQGTFNFGNIYFDFNKSNIKPVSHKILNEVYAYMTKYPDVKLEVQGHTDNVGTKPYNLKLSDARSKAVKNYLIKKGIAPSRLTSKGFGMSTPTASNKTKDGRAKNRRTEFKPIW